MYPVSYTHLNEQIVSILTEYAKKEGHHITIAYDGNQVLEQFSKQKFDAVLLDVMMPKRDGFEVCREIRKKSGVPIILITARGEDFERIMGLDIGADDYIDVYKRQLLSIEILPDKCKGCTLCARNCPVGAISGTVKEPHVIDQDKCVKCGVCMEKCRFGAIVKK